MIKALLVLINLLTNDQAVADLSHALYRFGAANTGMVLLIVGFVVVRRAMIRRNTSAPSRA